LDFERLVAARDVAAQRRSDGSHGAGQKPVLGEQAAAPDKAAAAEASFGITNPRGETVKRRFGKAISAAWFRATEMGRSKRRRRATTCIRLFA